MGKSILGSCFKRVAPETYEHITKQIGKFKVKFGDKRPYLTDSLGGDFKVYIKDDLDFSKLEKFKVGFDGESVATLYLLMERFEILTNQSNAFKVNPALLNNLMALEQGSGGEKIRKRLSFLKRTYGEIEWEESVGYFNHGLVFLPEGVVNKLKDTIVFDIGSYIGDSALMFEEIGFGKIISFDISRKSTEKYKKNISNYARNSSIFQHELLALSDTVGDVIKLSDNGSAGMSVLRSNSGEQEYEVLSSTVDEYCKSKQVIPNCIKADMEGFAYKMVKGAKEIIITHKPVLCLAIYHNPEEFFEIKLLLQELVPTYTFILRKLTPKIERNHCHSEVFLIAYHVE